MNPIHYKLIVRNTTDELNEVVSDYLNSGWSLYGTPSMSVNETELNLWPNYGQAIVKEDAEALAQEDAETFGQTEEVK